MFSRKQSKEELIPMAKCVLPQDMIILCILTRLSVKSLVRFKSVCKSWCELFSTTEFMKMHYHQFSSDPKNQSFIIHHNVAASYIEGVSLLSSIESSNKPRNFGQSCPQMFLEDSVVGCCNGLVCMGSPPLHMCFVLWNPALKLFKCVQFSYPSPDFVGGFSIGFGYDAEEADPKVVILVCPKEKIQKEDMGVGGVLVYSGNSDSWKTIELGFDFTVLGTKNDAIVNENPYWEAMVDEKRVLVWFDVRKRVFKKAPMDWNWGTRLGLMDWKGCVGALVYVNPSQVDVWGLDDGEEEIWKKNYSFGPIDGKVTGFWQCSKNCGKIVGEYSDGKLFVLDVESGCAEEILFDQTPTHYYGIYGYTESLAYVEGMEQQLLWQEGITEIPEFPFPFPWLLTCYD